MFNKEEEKEPKPWLLKSEVHESKGFGPVLSKGQAKKEEDVKKKEHVRHTVVGILIYSYSQSAGSQ